MMAGHPEGHGFFSIGVDAVAPSGAIYVEGREFMFGDLPARQGELAAHWSEADNRRGLGAQRRRSFDHGHASIFTPPTSSANSVPIGAVGG